MFFSGTKGMIESNLDAFFKAKSDGMSPEDALHFMILTRYSLFPKKREEFIYLYALFLSFIENPETSDMDFPIAFGGCFVTCFVVNGTCGGSSYTGAKGSTSSAEGDPKGSGA